MIDWAALEALFLSIPTWLLLCIVFVSAFAEGVPVVGAPFPGNTLVLLMGAKTAAAGQNPLPLVAAYMAGGMTADLTFYAVGKRYGLGFLERWTARLPKAVQVTPERRQEFETLLDRHAFKAVVISRVSPGLRNIFSYAAGAGHMRLGRFWVGITLGGLAVSVFFVGSGYLAGLGFESVGRVAGRALTYTAIVAVVVIGAGYVLTKRLRLFRPQTAALLFGAGLSVPAIMWLVLDHVRDGTLRRWEEAGGAHGVQDLLAPLGTLAVPPGVLLLVIVALAGVLIRRGAWRQAIGVLATTGIMAAAVVFLRNHFVRAAPNGSSAFPLATGFPDMTAALAVLAAAFLTTLVLAARPTWQLRVRDGLVWGVASLWILSQVAAGKVWPSDALAGAALGLSAASLGLLGDTFVTQFGAGAYTTDLGHRVMKQVRRGSETSLAFLSHGMAKPAFAWSLVGLGVIARLVGPWTWALGPDATRYAAMAIGFNRTGTFWMEWGDVYSPGVAAASHHYPPLYPLVLAAFYKVLGFSEDTTRIASIVLSLAALVVVWWCTRDLYGRTPARIVTAVVALSPVLIQTTNKAYSENFVLLLFVLALWAILKSLDRPWFIVLGGLFAGLAYLTKSSMGAFFVVAGLGGLAWRLYWQGWKVLRQTPYLIAIGIFGAMVAAWAWRNYRLFGDWQTSTHLQAAYAASWEQPVAWLALLPWSLAVMFGLGYLFFMGVIFWLPQLARIPRLASEHDSGLWLAFGLPVILTVIIDAALWNYEQAFYLHNVRYVSFAIVPLAWLLVRHVTWRPQVMAATLATVLLFVVGTAYYAVVPNVPVGADAAAFLGNVIGDGDRVAFVDTNDVYRAYFDLTHDGTYHIEVRMYLGPAAQNVTEDWVVAQGAAPDLPHGYALQNTFGSRDPMTVWKRVGA